MISIAAAAVLRNEADIVELFVRHTLSYVDVLYVIDHDSDDATPDILAALQREGLALQVTRQSDRAFRQGAWTTTVAREIQRRHGECAIVLLDADELLAVPDRAAFRAELAALPPDVPGMLRTMLHVVDPAMPDAAPIPQRCRHRYVPDVDAPPFAPKVVLPRRFSRHATWRVYDGNHAVLDLDRPGEALMPVPLATVAIAHFPVRSVDQIVAKACIGWWSVQAIGARAEAERIAVHWQALYGAIRDGESLDATALERFALAYQPDPALGLEALRERLVVAAVAHEVPQRYPTLARRLDAVASICRYIERRLPAPA